MDSKKEERNSYRATQATLRVFFAVLCLTFLLQPVGAGQSSSSDELDLPFMEPISLGYPDLANPKNAPTTLGVIPFGTILPIRLDLSLSSLKNKRGQGITGRVMQEVPLPNGAKIPEGSKVVGHIVAVTSGKAGARAEISLQFDRLIAWHRTTPIATNLRAIAGFMEVVAAQTPQIGLGEGDVARWQTTRQIGGDVVYGVGGPVTTAENAEGAVGSGVDSGVLVRVSAKPGSKCRGAIGGDDVQALWVFSSDACGSYGLAHIRVEHAGRTSPAGVIILASDETNLKISSGAGMLLRVD